MTNNRWLCLFRFVLAALISYEISFHYKWDNHFWSVVATLLTLQSIPNDRIPFIHALMIASDRIVGSILGCVIGLASYIFLATIILEDYFFWLVDIAIILNIIMSTYLYTANRRLQMAVVSSTLILTMSFSSDDISYLVLIYASEIMIGVIIACGVYVSTLPLFYWSAKSNQVNVKKLIKRNVVNTH